jgi:MYXO-CTERM domain-containing protein
VGPSIYLSILRDLSSTCAQSFREVDVDGQTGLESFCVGGLDYTMTFSVEKTVSPPPEVVPLPATLPLALAGMGLLFGLSRRRG